jgi:mRNA-degrading endonuclease RelE of RelBE toxin-antitoxin system
MKVFLASAALKHYKKLDNNKKDKINKKISLLSSSPFSGKKLTGEFKGSYSLRAWPYRIIYSINSPLHEIWIESILHRQGVYK